MRVLTWDELYQLRNALDDFMGYVSDNSCSDPDCCGGPMYEKRDFDVAETVLAGFGIGWNGSTD